MAGELFSQKNSDGRTWLHELLLSGNERAIDVALSPKLGLAWEIAEWLWQLLRTASSQSDVLDMTRDEKGMSLIDCCRCHSDRRVRMERRIEEFLDFVAVFALFCKLEGECKYETDPFEIPNGRSLRFFGDGDAKSVARRLVGFYRQ